MSVFVHPALNRLGETLVGNAYYVAGVCDAGPHDLELYYRKAGEKVARFTDFANATAEELDDFATTCQPATFGRGGENVLDETYRKAGKLDTGLFSTCLDLAMHDILDSVTAVLMDEESTKKKKLSAELYKLNVYGKGAFFKAHQDTPRGPNMIGSLVLVLPTEHEGGSLILRHKKQEWTFDSGKKLSESFNKPVIPYVAFYSDVEHEVTPVISGHRVTLTYNLYSLPRNNNDSVSSTSSTDALNLPLKAVMDELLADSSFLPSGGQIACALSHQYPFKKPPTQHDRMLEELGMGLGMVGYEYDDDGGGWSLQDMAQVLKGSDARLYRICQELGIRTKLAVAYETVSYFYHTDEEDEDDNPLLRDGRKVTVLFDRIVDSSEWGYVGGFGVHLGTRRRSTYQTPEEWRAAYFYVGYETE